MQALAAALHHHVVGDLARLLALALRDRREARLRAPARSPADRRAGTSCGSRPWRRCAAIGSFESVRVVVRAAPPGPRVARASRGAPSAGGGAICLPGRVEEERMRGALPAEEQARRPLRDLGRQVPALGAVLLAGPQQAPPLVGVCAGSAGTRRSRAGPVSSREPLHPIELRALGREVARHLEHAVTDLARACGRCRSARRRSARVPGTSSPSFARCRMVRDVEKPSAPAWSASRTSVRHAPRRPRASPSRSCAPRSPIT